MEFPKSDNQQKKYLYSTDSPGHYTAEVRCTVVPDDLLHFNSRIQWNIPFYNPACDYNGFITLLIKTNGYVDHQIARVLVCYYNLFQIPEFAFHCMTMTNANKIYLLFQPLSAENRNQFL